LSNKSRTPYKLLLSNKYTSSTVYIIPFVLSYISEHKFEKQKYVSELDSWKNGNHFPK